MKARIKTATPTTCSAVVTRYPTGCFGIDYQGSMFFWWGFGEEKVHAMLAHLRIPPQNVTWQERYYDRRFDFQDPRCYRTRKFIPHIPLEARPGAHGMPRCPSESAPSRNRG
jgi:hypothetical protein